MSECEDDEKDWYPQLSRCWPTAQLEAAKALYADLHDAKPFTNGNGGWAKERSFDFPFRYDEGVAFWMSPVDIPGEDFLRPSVLAADGNGYAKEAPDDADHATEHQDSRHVPGS